MKKISEWPLNGKDHQQLAKAIRSAFPSIEDLKIMLKEQLDINLEEISSSNRRIR